MSKVICERNDIVAIADAVRNKTGSTDQMNLGEIVTGINSITGSNNGTDTSDANATASDILSGKTAYVDGKKLTGTIPTRSIDDMTFETDSSFGYVRIPNGYYASNIVRTFPAGSARTPTRTFTTTPTISVDSTGKITASVNSANSITPIVSAGYVGKGTAGTITVSGSTIKQLTTQASKTITPSESSQTAVTSGVYTTGAITVAAIPSNYEDVTEETNAYTDKIASLESAVTALENELQGKANGGSSSGVEVEVITITETDTSQIPFTLKRVTKTIGSYNGDSAAGFPSVGSDIISSHINTYRFAYSGGPATGGYVNKSEALTLSSGELVASQSTFAVPYVAIFINDPTQPAIYEE